MNQEQRELAELLKESPKSALAVSQAVALVIRTAQQAIEQTGLTEDDLKVFFQEVERTNALQPLLDPTAWMRGGHDQINESRARGELVRRILKLPTRGVGLLDAGVFTASFGGDGEVKVYVVAPAEEESPT